MEEAIDLFDDDAGLKEIVEIDDPDEVIEVDRCEGLGAKRELDGANAVGVDPVKEARRRQKRRLHRILQSGVCPSFLAIISPENEGEENVDPPPKQTRINVDEYLGLNKSESPMLTPEDPSSNLARNSVLPSDEGYFEGIVSFSLPEDAQHLNELHLLIREQLEMFSANDDDVMTTQAGRRTRTVRGKVGIRCKHCAKVALETPVKNRTWPPGSVSYPVNIAGVYPVCSQKPQLHFENCPNIPQDIKGQLYRLANDPVLRRQRTSDTSSINANLYYAISARRIGMIDVDGGIRFGRDLKLEPLSLESVKVQVENDIDRFTRKGPGVVVPTPVLLAESIQPRIKADEESERVLARLVAEKNDPRILGRSDDSKLVSDCIFICVRSMAICNAVPADFETRGKKTKLMRIGFAGFCCRYCNSVNNPEITAVPVDFSCRSFSSHPDNLSSAISNSFYLHLQKCFRTPMEIRKALAAYKRLHTRQMARLPFGSQRKLFYALWTRLRVNDLSSDAMMERIKQLPQAATPIPSAFENIHVAPDVILSDVAAPDMIASTLIEDEERNTFFPFCDDDEAKAVICAAKEQDPSISDGLILSRDEHLVTEYVFLMMKQLKIAYPTPMDFSRGKRTTVLNVGLAGMCCRHCNDQDQASTGGRSFPSAPDNMASSLNTSLFQHMQRCLSLPNEIKRALATTKKVHSHQCANLKFGSQRRYFNLVFQRLQAVKTDINMAELARVKAEHVEAMGPKPVSLPANDITLTNHNFIAISSSCFECLGCRMIPLAFRAANSISVQRPTLEFMQSHSNNCKGNALDLTNVVDKMEKCIASHSELSLARLEHPDFVKVISVALGSNPRLLVVFTEIVFNIFKQETNATNNLISGLSHLFPTSINPDLLCQAFMNFANSVPGMDTSLVKNPTFLQLLQMISPFLVIHTKEMEDILHSSQTK